MNELGQIIQEAEAAIKAASDRQSLEDVRVHYLGKKGRLTVLLKNLGHLAPEERPRQGQAINDAKQLIQEQLANAQSKLQDAALAEQLAHECVDVSLPGYKTFTGSHHPISLTFDRVVRLLQQIGFRVIDGPEIEEEYYNFTALNMPMDHPARAMQDTFYIDDQNLLRTQTSPLQIREMLKTKPPLRVVAPGRVYRRDSDQTHSPMFHQIEGLVVDQQCNFAELKTLLHELLVNFFEREIELRFRPSYFPFTEPSAEVDIRYADRDYQGDAGWMEVLGCGMVHPQVLENVSIDPEKYSGYAFGIGVDRLAMLYYGVPDLRLFFENDLRFLQQF